MLNYINKIKIALVESEFRVIYFSQIKQIIDQVIYHGGTKF